jgi:hypothetical protein
MTTKAFHASAALAVLGAPAATVPFSSKKCSAPSSAGMNFGALGPTVKTGSIDRTNVAQQNGVTLVVEFFDGAGLTGGTCQRPVDAPTLEFAVYGAQARDNRSAFFRACKADGLKSHQVASGAQALAAIDLDGSGRVPDPDIKSAPYNSPDGAATLTPADTGAFTLDFGGVQSGGADRQIDPKAIDGNLNVIERRAFAAPVSVGAGVRGLSLRAA